MLEITIRCTCKICNEPLVISTSNEHSLFPMADNITLSAPFAAYHHKGFGDDNYVCIECEKCGAMYSLATGVISILCNLDDVHEDYKINSSLEFNSKQICTTFIRWLKYQKTRNDVVGDLAKDAFYTDGMQKSLNRYHDTEYPARPKNPNSFEEWVSFLHGKKEALTAFLFAWTEYSHQRKTEYSF